MSKFVIKNGNWYRNNSDGSLTKVQLKDDGHFYWTQSDGKRVRSAKKYRVVKKIKFNPRDTVLNLKHRAKIAKVDALTDETSAFHKPLNFLSPSLYFGALVDYLQGEKPFLKGVYDGNSGFVPELFAKEYPRATTVLNMVGDAITTKGVSKTYKYGTTPKLVGSGAEFDVYTAPFWNYVEKVGNVSPTEALLKSSVSGTVPLKYKGTYRDGTYLYTLKKAIIPKELPKSKTMSKLYLHLVNNEWFPYKEDSGMLDFVKLKETPTGMETTFVTDLGRGNIGFNNWFDYILLRLPVIIDNGVLNNSEYMALYEKKGGKLCLRK